MTDLETEIVIRLPREVIEKETRIYSFYETQAGYAIAGEECDSIRSLDPPCGGCLPCLGKQAVHYGAEVISTEERWIIHIGTMKLYGSWIEKKNAGNAEQKTPRSGVGYGVGEPLDIAAWRKGFGK